MKVPTFQAPNLNRVIHAARKKLVCITRVKILQTAVVFQIRSKSGMMEQCL